MSREEIRFLGDVAARSLSTTLSRYQRLHLSRRRGNAIRQRLVQAGIIKATPIATRSGQVVLYQLTDVGRSVCVAAHIEPGPRRQESLEHRYWVRKVAEHFRGRKYEVTCEHPIKGNGAIDILAERPGERVAIEVETGKSNIKANLLNVGKGNFDRIIIVATSPAAVSSCRKAFEAVDCGNKRAIEWLTWLDVS